MRQVTDVTKKGKIIISILCLIIAVLIVLIVTSTAEQFVYFFNNNFDQRHIDIKDYYPGFYRNVEHDDHIGYYLNSDVARVRFVKKENDPFSDGGAAYYFELIEWVNTYTDGYSELEALQKEMIKWYEKTDLVIFSPRYPGKYKSEMELIEATRGVYFEEGEEYGAGRMDRQLKILPFPHPDRSVYGADGKTSETPVRQTIVVDSELQMIVRKDIDPAKLKAVQDFFLYFNSQEGMAITTAYSAVPRPYRYEVPAEIAALASTYAKSVKNYLHNENTDMVLRAANNPLFNAKGGGTDYYSHYSYPFNSEYATGWSDYTIVYKFYEQANALQPNNITPRRWFEGIYDFTTKKISTTETRWHSYLREAGLVN